MRRPVKLTARQRREMVENSTPHYGRAIMGLLGVMLILGPIIFAVAEKFG